MAIEFESSGSRDDCRRNGVPCVGFGPDEIGPVIAQCLACLGVDSFEAYVERLRARHSRERVTVYAGQVFID